MKRMKRGIVLSQKGFSKKLLPVGAVLIACGLVVGCGTGAASTSSNNNTASPSGAVSLKTITTKPITLTMYVLPVAVEKATAEAQAKAFEKLHPNITIKVEENAMVGNPPAIISAAVGHTLPDIIWAADVNMSSLGRHGLLLNLSPYMKAYGYKESQFAQGMMKLGQFDGKQYIIPRGIDQVVALYNPNLFKKFHVPLPKEGWTWNTFVKDSKMLTQKVNGVQYWAVGTGGFTWNSYPMVEAFVRGYGGHFLNSSGTKTEINSPQAVKGITVLADYFRKYSAQFDNLPNDPFLSGRAAMDFVVRPQVMTYLNASRTAWASTPKGADLQTVNFPLFEKNPQIGAGMSGYAVTTQTKHPHAAAAFEMFLLSKKGELIRSKVAGSIPIRHDLKNSNVWRDAIKLPYTFHQEAFAEYTRYESLPPAKIDLNSGPDATAVNNALTEIQTNKMTPQAALNAAAQRINSLLSQ